MLRVIVSFVLVGLLLGVAPTAAQPDHSHSHDAPEPREITFPDIPGYHTLSSDLHIHTVFSDGSVWPDIRVREGLKDELDAIAMTDHLEYQPHQDDIPHPDRNRSYEIADEQVDDEELIVINGSEVTRSMPPGHANAVFLEDANALLLDDPKDVFREANQQDAFVFWNHPSWLGQTSDGIPPLSEMHRDLIDEGLLHGIEVVNRKRYSKEALRIALDHDLTLMGTSDIHGLVDWRFDVHDGGHRPTTLIFAEEHSEQALKEALFEGRTVVWKDNLLIGRSSFLVPLIKESLTVSDASYLDDTSVLELTIDNRTGQNFIVKSEGEFAFHKSGDVVTMDAHTATTLLVKTKTRLEEVELPVTVLNAVTAPDTHPEITFEVSVE